MKRTTRSAIRRLTIVLLIAVSGCQAPDGSGSGSSIAASPSAASADPHPNASPSTAAVDLTTILVPPASPPPGTEHDYTTEGFGALTRPVVTGRAAEFLNLEGFVVGRFETFSGDVGVFMSLGLLFDSIPHSEIAFEMYLDELLSDHGYAATVTGEGDLGDEGLCAEFDNPALGGLHEDACLWRNGSLVLIAGGTLQPDTILRLAQGMDERATGAAEY